MLLPLEVLYNSAKWANPYWRAKHGNKTVKNIQDLHEQKGLRLSKYQLSLITKKRNAALLRNKRYVAGNKIYKVISHYRQRKRINHMHGQVARVIQIRNQRIQNRKMHSVTNNNIAKIATILQRRFRLRQKTKRRQNRQMDFRPFIQRNTEIARNPSYSYIPRRPPVKRHVPIQRYNPGYRFLENPYKKIKQNYAVFRTKPKIIHGPHPVLRSVNNPNEFFKGSYPGEFMRR
jgi:hypothetical protein